jgi:hypothetical protein
MSERILALLLLASSPLFCAGWKAGVAKLPITPREPVFLSGYGNRDHPSEGTAQELHAKALALEDGSGGRLVIITTDLIGFSRTVAQAIAERIGAEQKLPRERILLTSSHTHSGPAIEHSLTGLFKLNALQGKAVSDYTRYLEDQTVQAAAQAFAALAPANLSFHRGEAGFASNRRVITKQSVNFGNNPDGPADRDVPLLRVTGGDGKLRAVLFSYACHNTTLGGDFYKFHGDYAGVAQELIEKDNPGAVALFMMGYGADANPKPRGTLENAVENGTALSAAVDEAMKKPGQEVAAHLGSAMSLIALPLAPPPSAEEFKKRRRDKNEHVKRHARRNLERLKQDGQLQQTYFYPVQAIQLGKQATIVALGGEVVVDYSIRLKREIGAEGFWPAGYANDVMAYIPSKRILDEGGYEADRSMIYYDLPGRWSDLVEDIIVAKALELVRQVRGE